MKIKKHFTYKSNKQIWRILISESEKVVIEKRDVESKEVFFDCFDLNSGDYLFSDFQMDEKYWIGIEKIFKDIIFFHKYSKPDMPGHQEIIAVDLSTQKVLWREKDYSFSFIYKDKVYVYKPMFEGRKYYSLDYKTGEAADEALNAESVNSYYDSAREEEDYSLYHFPERSINTDNLKINLDDAESIEYSLYNDVIFCSYHMKGGSGHMDQKFSVFSQKNGKEIFSETLCKKIDKLMTDSFFIYKSFLFLLYGKDGLKVYVLN